MLRALLIAAALAAPGEVLANTRLLTLDQADCAYCAHWDAEVGVVHDKTAEGRQAPSLRQHIHHTPPAGVTLARPALVTFNSMKPEIAVKLAQAALTQCSKGGYQEAVADQLEF